MATIMHPQHALYHQLSSYDIPGQWCVNCVYVFPFVLSSVSCVWTVSGSFKALALARQGPSAAAAAAAEGVVLGTSRWIDYLPHEQHRISFLVQNVKQERSVRLELERIAIITEFVDELNLCRYGGSTKKYC